MLAHEGIAGHILQFTTENHRCEFRTPDESVLLEYAALTGGRPHYICPRLAVVVSGMTRHRDQAAIRIRNRYAALHIARLNPGQSVASMRPSPAKS